MSSIDFDLILICLRYPAPWGGWDFYFFQRILAHKQSLYIL